MKLYIKESQIIKEYISNNEVSLLRYFQMSDEEKKRGLPYSYHYLIEDILEKDIEDSIEYVEQIDGTEEFNEIADKMFEMVENNSLPVDESEYPAWWYYMLEGVVKNQWMIHFTEYAEDIAEEGFTHGVYDIERLGITSSVSDFEKKYGGYNFAYDVDDYKWYYKNRFGNKYGSEAVLFRCSGVKLLHFGDEEPQIIFWGDRAKNIIPITECGEEAPYCVTSVKTGNIIYEGDFEEVVDWVLANYNQYRKHLHK